MGTPTGFPSFSLRVSLTADNLWGGRGQKTSDGPQLTTPPPPLSKKYIDLYCQLVSSPRLRKLLFPWAPVCCTHPSSIHSTCTHSSTHLGPGDRLFSALPWKSKAPQPFTFAPTPWAHLLSTKLCWTSRILELKPLNSLMFWKSWESSSREGTM